MPDSGKNNTQEIALGIVHHRPSGLILIGAVSDKALGNGFHPVGPLSFAGGGIEAGEWPSQTAEREVLEETGLVVRAIHYLGSRRREDVSRTVHYVVCVPVLAIDTSRIIVPPQAGEDIKSFSWVAPLYLLNSIPNLYPGVVEYLSTYQNRK